MRQMTRQAGADGGPMATPSAGTRHRRWRRKAVEPAPVASHPAVRILRSDELPEALHRAAQVERDAANVYRRRADRYEALVIVPDVTVPVSRGAPPPPSAA
jgi:hypothetical protein